MVTAEQILAQAQASEVTPTQVAAPQIVYVSKPQRGGSGMVGWLVAGAIALVAGGVWSGLLDIKPITGSMAIAQPTVVVRSIGSSVQIQPTAVVNVQSQATSVASAVVVPVKDIPLRFEATAIPPTPTTDPNLTKIVAMVNAPLTPLPVAGPPECSSENAPFKSHATVVDERNIPIGRVEAWSCASQADADDKVDAQAKEMIAVAAKK